MSKFIAIWANVSTIVAAIAAIVGFTAFENLHLIHNGDSQAEQRTVDAASGSSGLVRAGSKGVQPTLNDGEPITKACESLAKQAADDTVQGFLLSAERARRMRVDLQCGRSAQP